ncbi:hypothetical protein M6D93_18390 [Jatrophihabitans telluris]|uniref:Uncharacterized protein n=1 Tax=Jatrophihabitans telluris TaxID=2038343 RepID=A0ABY4QXD2_9ACTN|nr:hypothetical protein [Jatrophihabitans telluris]UQX88234.1 hypothetical protein M6D93_18390 [Jatrophihabitans telluris]
MPVIIVHGPPTESAQALLHKVNQAVAGALGLRPVDVHSMFSPAGPAATGEQPDSAWPTALLHGRARPPELMAAAVNGVSAVLAEEFDVAPGRVWVQWVLTG